MATEDDLIGFIYLASDLSNYVTGQDIRVDGADRMVIELS